MKLLELNLFYQLLSFPACIFFKLKHIFKQKVIFKISFKINVKIILELFQMQHKKIMFAYLGHIIRFKFNFMGMFQQMETKYFITKYYITYILSGNYCKSEAFTAVKDS